MGNEGHRPVVVGTEKRGPRKETFGRQSYSITATFSFCAECSCASCLDRAKLLLTKVVWT